MVTKTKSKPSKKTVAKVVAKDVIVEPNVEKPKFKNRGGSKFKLIIDDSKLHDIIMEVMDGTMGGHHELSGVTKPQDIIDNYRAVLFYMWGIPLDTPIDPDTLHKFMKAIERMKKEDPDLFKEPVKS